MADHDLAALERFYAANEQITGKKRSREQLAEAIRKIGSMSGEGGIWMRLRRKYVAPLLPLPLLLPPAAAAAAARLRLP